MQENNKSKLGFISLIKFIAVVVLIYQHVMYGFKTPIDIGARMCEILFVSSGFLVGYNHYDKDVKPTLRNSLKYIYKKLRTFYPLHLICLVLIALLEFNRFTFDSAYSLSLLANVTLTQSWSSSSAVFFSFNGVSWFLSSILFCYLLTPFLLQGIKKIKTSIILLCLVIFIRIMLEFTSTNYLNTFNINFHVNPFIRAMEFFIGMLMVPLFNLIKQRLNAYKDKTWIKISFTGVELVIPMSIALIIYFGDSSLNRGMFASIFALFIALGALNYGYISKLCSLKYVQKVFSYQLEMFMFQIVIFDAFNMLLIAFHTWYPENTVLEFLCKLSMIIAIAVIYKELCSKWLAKGMDFISTTLKRISE